MTNEKKVNENQNAVVKVEQPKIIVPKDPNINDLKKRIKLIEEERKVLTEFIKRNLVEGTDYGRIKIKSNRTQKEYISKPTLFKAGSEKFISLFNLKPTFVRDDETWEMAGRKPGLFCYVCYLYSPKGQIVGEGRGSCDVSEKGNVNEAIKIAEKRAQLDAVLRTGKLSDFFTQDLEDRPQEGITYNKPQERIGYDKSQEEITEETITPAQKNVILKLQESGQVDQKINVDELTRKQARYLISNAYKSNRQYE